MSSLPEEHIRATYTGFSRKMSIALITNLEYEIIKGSCSIYPILIITRRLTQQLSLFLNVKLNQTHFSKIDDSNKVEACLVSTYAIMSIYVRVVR